MFVAKSRVFSTLAVLALSGSMHDAGSSGVDALSTVPEGFGFDENNWRQLPGSYEPPPKEEFKPEVLCQYIKNAGQMPTSLKVSNKQFRDLMISVGGLQGPETISKDIKDWLATIYCYYMDRPEFQPKNFMDTKKYFFEIDMEVMSLDKEVEFHVIHLWRGKK